MRSSRKNSFTKFTRSKASSVRNVGLRHVAGLVVTAVMFGVFSPPPAVADNVLPGVDLFSTPWGGATVDSHFTVMPIPADFFDPGSDPFDQPIELEGEPIPEIWPADVIVERQDTAFVPACGDSDSVPIEMIALSLKSTHPITVTYDGGQDPELWDVKVCLSSVDTQHIGSMIIRHECSDGGTFDATLPVTPRFIFTRQSDLEQRVLDLGDDPTVISFQTVCGRWTYFDPGFGIVTSPGGDSVDHDCNPLTAKVLVAASSNFFPGVWPIPCDCINPADTHYKRMTREQALLMAHGVLPPEEEGPDYDSDGIHDLADNCPYTYNPLQEDSDCDGTGDACELFVRPGANGVPLPAQFILSQNYPNPFNPITEIKYALPKDSYVRLEIYNLLGQKVASLVDGKQKAGYKTARWDAGSFSSGVYFYRLQAGSFVQTRKMVLIK